MVWLLSTNIARSRPGRTSPTLKNQQVPTATCAPSASANATTKQLTSSSRSTVPSLEDGPTLTLRKRSPRERNVPPGPNQEPFPALGPRVPPPAVEHGPIFTQQTWADLARGPGVTVALHHLMSATVVAHGSEVVLATCEAPAGQWDRCASEVLPGLRSSAAQEGLLSEDQAAPTTRSQGSRTSRERGRPAANFVRWRYAFRRPQPLGGNAHAQPHAGRPVLAGEWVRPHVYHLQPGYFHPREAQWTQRFARRLAVARALFGRVFRARKLPSISDSDEVDAN